MSFYISPNTDYLMMVLTNINNNNNKFLNLKKKRIWFIFYIHLLINQKVLDNHLELMIF